MKQKKHFQKLTILYFVFLLSVLSTYGQKEESQIDDKYKWDLTAIYKTDNEWNTAKTNLESKMSDVGSFQGKLTLSAKDLFACLDFMTNLKKEASKLYTYASLKSDLDKRDMTNSGMEKELQQIFSDFSAASAYVNPEILSMNWETIENYFKQEPKLEIYRQSLLELFRQKTHTLSQPEERIMALSSVIESSPYNIFSTFSNAEFPSPEITLTNGEKIKLDNAGYERYRVSPNRKDREIVFKTFWNNYKNYEATFGEMLSSSVNVHMFEAKARNYQSCLEAALDPNNIPSEVYKSLVENVNKNLPAFYRYLKIKKRMLGVDTLRYLDLYAPVVKDVNLNYTFDESKDLVLKALIPMGPEYVATVTKALNERWIDVYPSTGKRSGGYSSDGAYDVHPYILLNYNNHMEDVFTLSHELGHTMHSFYSLKTQPYVNADYATFVAEVASTFNEVLLFNYIIKTIKDDDVKLTLLMNWLDRFKGTIFRQTQFADFELKIHEAAEAGIPLTGEYLSKLYGDIAKKYYGHDQGICYVDDYMNMEWAFIPHFYMNFYVFQYSTSFTASLSLSESILNKEKGAVEKYINFLSSGGSDYPIELLKKAGVDMTTSAPFDKSIQAMNQAMDEIEKILSKKGK